MGVTRILLNLLVVGVKVLTPKHSVYNSGLP